MKHKPDPKYMRLAIKEAEKSARALGGGPFGACIVKAGKIVAAAGNTVFKEDATCHAEINAIRIASKKLKTYDLSGCAIYTTTEPCPMCFSAIHWAGIDHIIFGSTISDATDLGFNELSISARTMKKLGGSRVKIVSGFCAAECRKLFKSWNAMEKKDPGLIGRDTPYYSDKYAKG